MRHAALCMAFGAALIIGGRLRASSRLDQPHRDPFRVSASSDRHDCWMLELFDQVARHAHVPMGFENLRHCGLGPRSLVTADAQVLDAHTPREAFDEVVAMAPAFRWREVDGVVVIRPITAWDDADDILNRAAASFQLVNAPVEDAVYRALDAAEPALRFTRSRAAHAYRGLEAPVSVDFSGGTVLGALNAIARARGDAEWRIAYAHNDAMIVLSAVSTLDGSRTVFVRSVAWQPIEAALRPALH